MIRTAIIGFGFMGRTHFGCYRNQSNCEVVAVVTRDRLRREGKPVAHGNLPVGTDCLDLSGVVFLDEWRAAIDDKSIDLIDICAPTHLHAEIAIAALEAGKHVIVEKPMARSGEEAEAMARAAKASGRLLHVGHVLRFWGQYVEAWHLIDRRELGAVKYARFERHGGMPGWSADDWLADPARSGGVVFDLASHDIDAALWFFGAPAEIDVRGQLRQGAKGPLAMTMDAEWIHTRGMRTHIHSRWDSQSAAPFRYAFYLEFERASLYCDSNDGAALRLIEGGIVRDLPFDARSPFQNEIDEVLATIAEGRTRTRYSAETALQTLRMTERHLVEMK